jgi:hypothetical protein
MDKKIIDDRLMKEDNRAECFKLSDLGYRSGYEEALNFALSIHL